MRSPIRALVATSTACAVLILGGGPAIAGPVTFPTASGTTASVAAPLSRAITVAEDEATRPLYLASHGRTDVQTDEEEAAEVRTMLVLVGSLTALTVLVGALAARGR